MIFWILITALTVFAVAITVWPLLMGRPSIANSEHESQLAVLRDRRDEIARDLDAGRITPAEADSANQELVAVLTDSLSKNASDGDKPVPGASSRPLFAALSLAVFVPVAAYLIYAIVGQPMVGAYLADNDINQQPNAQQIAGMIDDIVARTKSHPNDGEAWLALAQARKMQGDMPASVAAFDKAATLITPTAGVLADYAEAIALTKSRNFAGKPQRLLQRAFELDPQHVKVNALLGASYFQAGERQKALPYLKRFVASIDAASDQALQINRLIASIESAPNQAAGRAPSPASEPDESQVAGLVRGTITLSGEAPEPGATLFVSARLPTGPRMPFAAVRLPANEFPLKFELSDANAMSPARKLSSASQVVVEARISQSGQAMRQSGDRFGVSAPVPPGQAVVTILINQRVP